MADPLSADPATAQRALDQLKPGGGTAIGDGLNLALDQLRQRPAGAQGARAPAEVVLLSDGESNTGQPPATAAARAAQLGVQWVEERTEVTFLASAVGAALLTAAGALGLFWFGRLP